MDRSSFILHFLCFTLQSLVSSHLHFGDDPGCTPVVIYCMSLLETLKHRLALHNVIAECTISYGQPIGKQEKSISVLLSILVAFRGLRHVNLQIKTARQDVIQTLNLSQHPALSLF